MRATGTACQRCAEVPANPLEQVGRGLPSEGRSRNFPSDFPLVDRWRKRQIVQQIAVGVPIFTGRPRRRTLPGCAAGKAVDQRHTSRQVPVVSNTKSSKVSLATSLVSSPPWLAMAWM